MRVLFHGLILELFMWGTSIRTRLKKIALETHWNRRASVSATRGGGTLADSTNQRALCDFFGNALAYETGAPPRAPHTRSTLSPEVRPAPRRRPSRTLRAVRSFSSARARRARRREAAAPARGNGAKKKNDAVAIEPIGAFFPPGALQPSSARALPARAHPARADPARRSPRAPRSIPRAPPRARTPPPRYPALVFPLDPDDASPPPPVHPLSRGAFRNSHPPPSFPPWPPSATSSPAPPSPPR